MTELTRRRLLLGTAGVGIAALAGCVSDADDEETDSRGNNEAAIEESTINYVGSNCAGPEPDAATVFVDDESYTIEGTLPSPTPCYEPELVEAELTDGELAVTVDIAEDLDDDEECVECAGEVEYDAVIELDESAEIERLSVTHESGEELTIEAEQFRTDRPELLASEIETTRQDSRGDDTEMTAVDVGDETVTITGAILTPTPHYEATLEDATIERQALRVMVDVESTLEDDGAGTTELGVIEYEATFEVEHGDAIDSVSIDHPETSHTVELEEVTEKE